MRAWLAVALVVAAPVTALAESPLGAVEADQVRITAHLAQTERALRARDVSGWSEAAKTARTHHLDVLAAYWHRGVFPRNEGQSGRRVPTFVDGDGRACAVAALALADGQLDAVARVAQTQNNALLADIHDPALAAWAEGSGLSLDELGLIQPQYCECPSGEWPVCGADGVTYENACVALACGGTTVSACGACTGEDAGKYSRTGATNEASAEAILDTVCRVCWRADAAARPPECDAFQSCGLCEAWAVAHPPPHADAGAGDAGVDASDAGAPDASARDAADLGADDGRRAATRPEAEGSGTCAATAAGAAPGLSAAVVWAVIVVARLRTRRRTPSG